MLLTGAAFGKASAARDGMMAEVVARSGAPWPTPAGAGRLASSRLKAAVPQPCRRAD